MSLKEATLKFQQELLKYAQGKRFTKAGCKSTSVDQQQLQGSSQAGIIISAQTLQKCNELQKCKTL